jgi:ABC-2 type transport system permease protein
MRNLIRNCIYQAKHNFRDKGFLFWSLLYPILMMTFFHIAFSGVMDFKLEEVKVGIERDNPAKDILESIDFIDTVETSGGAAEALLEKGEIDGFIDGGLNIAVSESGMNQTLIKEVVDEIRQIGALGAPYENYDFTVDYISDRDQRSNSLVVMFYSLIAMVAAYSVYPGLEPINLIQANLSDIGARLSVSPLKKQSFLVAGGIVAMGLNIMSNALLLLFTKYFLRLELFYNLKYSLLLILMGNLFGVSLGMFIGASNRKSLNFKTAICIATTLFLAALSGLFGPWIKLIVDSRFGALSRMNPISIVSNNLYRVNFLENTDGLLEGVLLLGAYSALLFLLSFVFLRRRRYDSI